MKPVTGVFPSREDAERAVQELSRMGVPKNRIALLTPGTKRKKMGSVPTTPAEQPGMGKAIGGVVGASAGLATGMEVAAVTSAMIPGVGTVIAMGFLGAAILGLAGARIGTEIDEAMTEGLPADELFVYEDALRKSRSVVIAFTKDESAAKAARRVMEAERAESIDSARNEWWIGLRSAEKEHYPGKDFDQAEQFYRMGFERALHARQRCKEYDQIITEMSTGLEELKRQYPNANVEEPYRLGYERGRSYYDTLCNKTRNRPDTRNADPGQAA